VVSLQKVGSLIILLEGGAKSFCLKRGQRDWIPSCSGLLLKLSSFSYSSADCVSYFASSVSL